MAPQRSSSTRTRTGCATCRKRHIKCDEERPECANCKRLQLTCGGYPAALLFCDATQETRRRSRAIESRKWAAIRGRGDKEAEKRTHRSPATEVSPHVSVSRPAIDRPEDEDVAPSCQPQSPSASPLPHPFTPSFTQVSEPTEIVVGDHVDLGTTPQSLDGSLLAPHSWVTHLPTASLSSLTGYADSIVLGSQDASLNAVLTSPAAEPVEPSPLLQDVWLTRNFPKGLQPVFKRIWETVGYSNPAMRNALLALLPVPLDSRDSESREREQRLQAYSLALQETARQRHQLSRVTDVAVSLAILCLLLVIELRMGTFSGGVLHCTESDHLVMRHIDALGAWELGRDLLCSWTGIRCWYDTQFLVWQTVEGFKTEALRDTLRPLLREAPDKSHLLVSVLSDSVQVMERIMLGRLVGPKGTWPTFRPWARQLLGLGLPAPDPVRGFFKSGSENLGLTRLATSREHLDAWHAGLSPDDLPLPPDTHDSVAQHAFKGAAGASSGGLSPASAAVEPLYFSSHDAAMNYLRYAAAQHACSTENLDRMTGGCLGRDFTPSPWIRLCLRIISGLSVRATLEDNAHQLGVVWIVCKLVVTQAPTQDVLDLVDGWRPWLVDLASGPGSICPAWFVRHMLALARREQDRGRHLLFSFCDVSPAQERTQIASGMLPYRSLNTGRLIEEGTTYFESVRTAVEHTP